MNYKLLILVAISFLLLNLNLGKWGLQETSEARYAEISREMVVNNDYVHPTLLGIYHYHKPPITYQITALGYKIFGINEFGARFFLQVAIILQLLLVYKISILLFSNRDIAMASTLIYFSLPIVLISSRNLTTDAYLNTFILASVCSWLVYKIKSKPFFLLLFYISIGIAFEIKGPVSLIFPLVFILMYKIANKDRLKFSLYHLLGVILFLVISSVWYILVFFENKAVFDYFIKDQILDRIASKSYNRSKPFWFYLLTVPLIGLPWVFIIIHYLKSNWKKVFPKKTTEYVLIASIIILTIIFSLFKTKLILYILPAFGFLAIAAAKAISNSTNKNLGRYNKVLIILSILFLLALFSISILKINFKFSTVFTLSISVLSIVAIMFVLKKSFVNNYTKTAILSFIFGCIILASGTQFLIQNEDNLSSPKKAIQYINNNLNNTNNILVYNYLISSAPFYSDKNIITLDNGHNTVQRETQFEKNLNWEKSLINLKTEEGKERAEVLFSNNSVLLTRKKHQLPKSLSYLKQKLKRKKDFGNWVIHY